MSKKTVKEETVTENVEEEEVFEEEETTEKTSKKTGLINFAITGDKIKPLEEVFKVIKDIIDIPIDIIFDKDGLEFGSLQETTGVFVGVKIKKSFFHKYKLKDKELILTFSVKEFAKLAFIN